MHTVSFLVNEQLNKKLIFIAEKSERSKGYVLRKALESYLEDQEDLDLAIEALEEFNSSGGRTYTLKNIKDENGL